MSHRLSQRELIEALELTAQGDRAAFEKVYDATATKVFGVILRILGRRDLAEEALQDVYVRVWQRASEFNAGRGSPITWLATIARNRALDEARRKTVRSLEDCPELLDLASAEDPLGNCERAEERRRLQICLECLEPEKRHVVLLAYHGGMTREEISRLTKRPVPTVKTWLRRSLAQLKDCLAQ